MWAQTGSTSAVRKVRKIFELYWVSHFFSWSITILLLYVDDIILSGNNFITLQSVIQKLASVFAMKDLRPLHYFLGLAMCHSNGSLFLSQTRYAIDLLRKYKIDGTKFYASPVINGTKLSILDGDPLPDPSEYCSVVRALQYLTWTRPDISFIVNQVCQFMHTWPDFVILMMIGQVIQIIGDPLRVYVFPWQWSHIKECTETTHYSQVKHRVRTSCISTFCSWAITDIVHHERSLYPYCTYSNYMV